MFVYIHKYSFEFSNTTETDMKIVAYASLSPTEFFPEPNNKQRYYCICTQVEDNLYMDTVYTCGTVIAIFDVDKNRPAAQPKFKFLIHANSPTEALDLTVWYDHRVIDAKVEKVSNKRYKITGFTIVTQEMKNVGRFSHHMFVDAIVI